MRLTNMVVAFATLTQSACSAGGPETPPSATASDGPSAAPSGGPSTASATTTPRGPWARLATGMNLGCAANTGGDIVCWGRTPEPTHVRGLSAPKGVALAVSDDTVCVGPPGRPVQCVDFAGGAPFEPRITSARALRLDGGLCALDDARVECASGRLDLRDPPVPVEGLTAPTAFDAGGGFLCAIDADIVKCGSFFAPRPPSKLGAPPPVLAKPIPGMQDTVEVAVNGMVCARTKAGAVLCLRDKAAKVVAGLPKATQIAVGTGTAFVIDRSHACALDEVGAVRCWGNNNDGQLGAPSDRCRTVDLHLPKTGPDHLCDEPLLVEGLPPVAELAAGSGFTCALTPLGDVYCWGQVNDSQGRKQPHLMEL